MRETKPKTYRVQQSCIDGVKTLAERWDATEGEVIERLVAGGLGNEPEKKSGGAREVLQDDIPDEVLEKPAKVKSPLAKLMKGSEVPQPSPKKGLTIADVKAQEVLNQCRDLKLSRANAQPYDRNRQAGK